MKPDLPNSAASPNHLGVVAATESLVALSELAPGRAAKIVSVDSDSQRGRRLMDLGLLPGTRIVVVRRAPLGDPIQFELRGYNLCLRRSEASSVRVRVE